MHKLYAIIITALLWLEFIGSFLLFGPLYAVAWCFRSRRKQLFQDLNRSYLRCFLAFVRCLLPFTKWHLPTDQTAKLHSTVVICNHLSFLDPLLFVSIVPRTITIVRSDFFRMPFFGWLIKGAGYLSQESLSQDLETMDSLLEHLHSGGNVLVFPEGTRSRNGELGPFLKGAFYLARQIKCPLELYEISGTDKVFPPDNTLFQPLNRTPVEIVRVAEISVAEIAAEQNTRTLLRSVRQIYLRHMNRRAA